jgi:hypothetical protein
MNYAALDGFLGFDFITLSMALYGYFSLFTMIR